MFRFLAVLTASSAAPHWMARRAGPLILGRRTNFILTDGMSPSRWPGPLKPQSSLLFVRKCFFDLESEFLFFGALTELLIRASHGEV